MIPLVLTTPWQFFLRNKSELSWNDKMSKSQLGDGYHGFIRDRADEIED